MPDLEVDPGVRRVEHPGARRTGGRGEQDRENEQQKQRFAHGSFLLSMPVGCRDFLSDRIPPDPGRFRWFRMFGCGRGTMERS
ncbi:MAG: hypothetical protein Kow00128_01060 [Deltaproteobacteria bacterium]